MNTARHWRKLAGAAALVLALQAGAAELGIKGTRFTIDRKPTFLLGASYYAGCGAPKAFIRADLDDLKKLGFNWIRVWAVWSLEGTDISAVDRRGAARPAQLEKLKFILKEADARGMIVDVTLSRGNNLPNQAAHLRAVKLLARELKPFRNAYFDLANERNIQDARFVGFADLRALRDAVKRIDPKRLLTASQGGDISKEEAVHYLKQAGVDFLTPHRPRSARSPSETEHKTRQLSAWARAAGKPLPVHYQEPFRRDYGRWQPEEKDFLDDCAGAARGGAAGWCFHNGSPRFTGSEKKGPFRSFDMRPRFGRLMDQLDPVEKAVVEKLAATARKALAAAGRKN